MCHVRPLFHHSKAEVGPKGAPRLGLVPAEPSGPARHRSEAAETVGITQNTFDFTQGGLRSIASCAEPHASLVTSPRGLFPVLTPSTSSADQAWFRAISDETSQGLVTQFHKNPAKCWEVHGSVLFSNRDVRVGAGVVSSVHHFRRCTAEQNAACNPGSPAGARIATQMPVDRDCGNVFLSTSG